MSWQASALIILAIVVVGGFVWFERSRPSARIVAAVAALAALGVAGRLILAPVPNVVATTDVALLAGYTLGGGPGFAVGALSGLVSNFWLGQGPWTPWQMAGWGMVGIAGAMLAAGTGRSLNRWGLAAVAALMGFLYGALLDLSVMVSYGGEQSLDRYLALSARGIPFNVVHATGNFVLMLAAGPAMVRMLDRYRERFDVTWSETPLPRAAAAGLVAACLALPLLAPPGDAAAQDDTGPGQDELSARAWLADAQNKDGGFGAEPGVASNPGMTGWAMLGLEAAGYNPRDLAEEKTPVDYLRKNLSEIDSTADLERTILALDGAGVDPRDFGGEDLVAQLRKRVKKDGSYESQINLTAFAILAQKAAGVSSGNYGKSAAWLRSAQNRNGGWGSVEDAESEPDSTGAALQALAVSPGGSGEIDDGARWLYRAQRGDGGWSLTAGAPSNSQSTAWAIQGLTAAGDAAADVKNDGRSGLDYLAARQRGDGRYSYSKTSDQTPVWVTAQALTGVAEQPFPLEAVPSAVEDANEDSAGDTDPLGSGTTPTTPTPTSSSYDGTGSGLGSGLGGATGGEGGGGAPVSSPKGGNAAAPTGDRAVEPTAAEEAEEEPTDMITAETMAAFTDQGEPTTSPPLLIGILVAIALALGAGFLWYRRRLP